MFGNKNCMSNKNRKKRIDKLSYSIFECMDLILFKLLSVIINYSVFKCFCNGIKSPIRNNPL